jgi:hypothetical protein
MEGSIQTCIEHIVPPNSFSTSNAAALRLTALQNPKQTNFDRLLNLGQTLSTLQSLMLLLRLAASELGKALTERTSFRPKFGLEPFFV